MAAVVSDTWREANKHYLAVALTRIGEVLQRHIARAKNATEADAFADAPFSAESDYASSMSPPPALEVLCGLFGLSSFERNLLLLCAGMELDTRFAALCAAAQGDPQRPYPTFSLALAVFPTAHWSALTPSAPLRRWRLIEVGEGKTLTLSPLRIDETVLHYLAGVHQLDHRLTSLVRPVLMQGALVPSQQQVVDELVGVWVERAEQFPLPVIQLSGDDRIGKQVIAAACCAALGLRLSAVVISALPTGPREIEALLRLWEREAALSGSALLIDCEDLDRGDHARANALAVFIVQVAGPVFIASRERQHHPDRVVVTVEVPRPATSEQRWMWQQSLGPLAPRLNGHVEHLVAQFNLGPQAIQAVCMQTRGRLNQAQDLGVAQILWDACRIQARARLDDLAQRIEPAATWDDLILPDIQRQILHDIAAHVRQRATVYETWGFATKGERGLGLSALFAGASGTGKTMAAEVLAHELHLDLYCIDLSAVVSKYIGETEKNLRQIFDAAEAGGAILLFDEADALFGKRSEVKDSHDRYANIEVSYLLQRMECYQGLAILTTNLKNSLDPAFLRRIRFVVQFPFPDAGQRAEIWRRIFPRETPTADLDPAKLARLTITGGNIRSIALNAAFLAADAAEPVRMGHLLRAAQGEYNKLEKPLTDAEVAGWV